MRRVQVPLGIIAVTFCALTWACGSERDRACAELAKAESAKDSTPAGTVARRTFWSATLETCIQVRESRTGVDFVVDDLSDNFLQTMVLFECDRAGVDAAILDSVRAHHGDVWTLKYDHWLTNGEGGPPRTLLTPAEPYTDAKCRAAMTKFLAAIE